MPMARAAPATLPQRARAAMKSRWRCSVQPLRRWRRRGTGVKAMTASLSGSASAGRVSGNLAIIYLRKQPVNRNNQDGYEPDELAVTPQMIEAGVEALERYREVISDQGVAQEVYNAM